MSDETVRQVGHRLAEHARAHGLRRMEAILHGGEPLLAGPERISFVATTLRAAAEGEGCEVDLTVQTNGTLIDETIVRVLAHHGVRVCVSFDGSPEAHDAHRVHPNGRGSYAELVRGVSLLRELHPELFAGLLCVVDVGSDPVATYENLLGFRPPAVDLLLPHANWGAPPYRPAGSEAAYGEWLVAVFDRWYGAPAREMSVRYFDEILGLLLGRPSRIETIGLSPAALIVVETDGSIEQTDALKSAYDGAASTGLDVFRSSFDDALATPQIAARQLGAKALSPECLDCDVWGTCGGGFYPHRYEPGSGFRNRSVYCADLEHLIRHIAARVQADLAARRSAAPLAGVR